MTVEEFKEILSQYDDDLKVEFLSPDSWSYLYIEDYESCLEYRMDDDLGIIFYLGWIG